MKKILTIAAREYRAMVATKAFLLSILIMPVLMFGSLIAVQFLEKAGESKNRKIVVVDQSGSLFEVLDKAALQLNQLGEQGQSPVTANGVKGEVADDAVSENKPEKGLLSNGNSISDNRFELIRWAPGADGKEFSDADRMKLSEQIRAQQIYAFVEIPASVGQLPEVDASNDPVTFPAAILFFSEDSGFSDAKTWIGSVVSNHFRTQRFLESGIDPVQISWYSQPVAVRGFRPFSQSAAGDVSRGEESDPMQAIFLPLGVMMLMFMVIFMASQPMLESVLEEKSARIAEVLLGSASAWQLMTGKLIGTVAGSLTIFLVYLGGAIGLAIGQDWLDYIPLSLIPWFVIFQILGVLFFASIFLAVGASVNQLKEAQSLLLPVWMLLMSPMFVWILLIRDPNGSLATWFSFFPPATPTVMVLRMSTGATIPVWQPILGIVLVLLVTSISIYVAARIFRVGLLWQGKTPRFSELVRWAFWG